MAVGIRPSKAGPYQTSALLLVRARHSLLPPRPGRRVNDRKCGTYRAARLWVGEKVMPSAHHITKYRGSSPASATKYVKKTPQGLLVNQAFFLSAPAQNTLLLSRRLLVLGVVKSESRAVLTLD